MARFSKQGIYIFFSFLCSGVAAEFLPRSVPVAGLPEGLHEFCNAVQTSQGWVVATTEGVVYQSNGGWKLWRPVAAAQIRVALPFANGQWVVAGSGFCSLVSADGSENSLLTQGKFTAGSVLGNVAIIVGASEAYAIGPSGVLARLSLSGTGAYAHEYKGQQLVFSAADGVFVYTDGRFESAEKKFNWAHGRSFISLNPTPDARNYLAAGRQALVLVSADGKTTPFLSDIWPTVIDRWHVGSAMDRTGLIVATYKEGLFGYSFAGIEQWRLDAATFGGNPEFLRPYGDGFLVGTSTGMGVVPNPSRYRFVSLPGEDLYFVARSSRGGLVGTSAGVFHLDGRKTEFLEPAMDLLETPTGFVQRIFERVILPDGKVIPTGDREATFVPLSNGARIATLQTQQVWVVAFDGSVSKLGLPFSVNSIAPADDDILVGSLEGAKRITTDGIVRSKFGTGRTRVFPVGDRGAAIDVAGDLFDAKGRLLGRLPFSEVLSAVEWEDGLVVLARLPDNRFTIGKVQLAPFRWRPFDLPLTATPRFLAAENNQLYVISPRQIMTVTKPLELKAPSAEAIITAVLDGRGLKEGTRLAASEDAVKVSLPQPRLGPWANPSYAVRVDDGAWQDASPGAEVRLQRLSWGSSVISVKASLAGLESVTSFGIERQWPWWTRWPAMVLYVAGFFMVSWLIVRWRTALFARRARELQIIVDERTAELKQAQQAREEFFSTLSHEIRNPLNGVVGLCDILDEAPGGSVAPRERMLVRTLKGCASQLRSMLDDVLDFARIDRGDIQLHDEAFELGSAIEGAVRAVDAGLTRCTLELPSSFWLQGDCGKFRQVVTNLVSNALKYGIPPGGARRGHHDGGTRWQRPHSGVGF